MPKCNVDEIFRDGYCKAKPGMSKTDLGMRCNVVNPTAPKEKQVKRLMGGCESNRYKKACSWVEGKCISKPK